MLKRWNFLKTGFYEGIKLTFVSPQLVKRGGIAELTAGTFWGTFMSGAEYPPADTGGQEPP